MRGLVDYESSIRKLKGENLLESLADENHRLREEIKNLREEIELLRN